MNVAQWFRDRTLRKVVKYGVPAFLGKLLLAVSGLITLAILTRYLGPEPFGVIAMFRTVVTLADTYGNFNTWQAIIKFGTEAIADQRPEDVKRIIKLAFLIDISTAVLGALVIVVLALTIPGAFSWSSHEALLCMIYAITLVSKVAGTSDGIFRICDAYRVQAIVSGLGALTGTGIVAIAVALGASFDGCVVALVVGEVATNITMTLAAFWVARKSGYGGWMNVSLVGMRTTFPGITRFMVATNAQLTVKATQGDVDMIVVGSMLGKASAGLFRVIKQVGSIPGRIFLPFELVLFTELARCAAAHDYAGFRRLLTRSVGIALFGSLAIWGVAALLAKPLIELVAGEAFISAAPAFRWYLLAMVIQVCSITVQRSLVALGRPGTLFLFDAASLILLIGAAILAAHLWGTIGVAFAVLLHKTVQLGWSAFLVRSTLRRLEVTALA